ncbi:hypothetical protein [Collimonas pratensis]|nr:hypothetical protein [Collimonas pratensis]
MGEASLPFNSFIMANVDRHWPPAWQIAGILLVLLEFSAIPMRAAVAVCIILHFVLRSNGAGIRAPGLHLYWIDTENLHGHIRLALSISTYILQWRLRRGFAGGKRNSGVAPPNGLAAKRLPFR